MNWTMPYPWRSRSDSVRRINMSSEPGNESFFCALRPIPRILSLRWRDARVKFRLASPRAARRSRGAHAHRMRIARARCRCRDRKSTRLNSSHVAISYAVFCLKKKKRRSATVKAAEPVEALRIPAEGFQAFLLEHPAIAVAMLSTVGERLGQVEARS